MRCGIIGLFSSAEDFRADIEERLPAPFGKPNQVLKRLIGAEPVHVHEEPLSTVDLNSPSILMLSCETTSTTVTFHDRAS